ncbi:MAG: hypothetical protein IJP76_07410 [Paludibacteraceae bacterium]|nr:hypothetical protein [Paludibacteraceae bacterium]
MRKFTILSLLLLAGVVALAQQYSVTYQGYPFKLRTSCDEPFFTAGEHLTLSAGKPSIAGKEFTGWLYDGTLYQPAQKFIMPAKDVVLVPIFDNEWPTAIDQQQTPDDSRKVLENGVLFLINNGVKYSIMGERVQ